MNSVIPRHSLNLLGLIANPVFVAAFLSWFLTQIFKVVYGLMRGKLKTPRAILLTLFWKTGGMPSSHAALVAGVSTAIAFDDGISSDIFVLSLCFALIVIRDAMGVRRSAGSQARALNELGRELRVKMGVHYRPVKEVLGHTPAEVTVGIIVGILIALCCSLLL
jgi:uncharacterized protein